MSALKHPLQAILIAPDETMRFNILSGKKQITIREGHRDYRPGLAMICCHLDPYVVQVTVTDVQHRTLDDVTQEEWEADGFTSKQDLLDGMRVFYPHLEFSSPITIIRWNNVCGELVEWYNSAE